MDDFEIFARWCQENGYGDAMELIPYNSTAEQIEAACDRLDEAVDAYERAVEEHKLEAGNERPPGWR